MLALQEEGRKEMLEWPWQRSGRSDRVAASLRRLGYVLRYGPSPNYFCLPQIRAMGELDGSQCTSIQILTEMEGHPCDHFLQ